MKKGKMKKVIVGALSALMLTASGFTAVMATGEDDAPSTSPAADVLGNGQTEDSAKQSADSDVNATGSAGNDSAEGVDKTNGDVQSDTDANGEQTAGSNNENGGSANVLLAPTNKLSETESSLYERLMAATTAEDMLEILDSPEGPSFTTEELTALYGKAESFEEDEEGYKSGVLAILGKLITGENEIDLIDVTVEINNNISTNGTLVANASDTTQTYTYVWYKSSDGTTWTQITSKTYTLSDGTTVQNPSSDTTSLNVGLDDGARQYYKVQAYVGDTKVGESEPYQVPYYSSLQNGDFEIPDWSVNKDTGRDQWSQTKYLNNGGVWQTTGKGTGGNTGKDIEIWSTTQSTYEQNWSDANNSNPKTAAHGTQFAELNCEAAGALYQDVLTVPGVALNYWLSHRARYSKKSGEQGYSSYCDTMYLVIAPTSSVSSLTTQTQLENYLKNTLNLGSVTK